MRDCSRTRWWSRPLVAVVVVGAWWRVWRELMHISRVFPYPWSESQVHIVVASHSRKESRLVGCCKEEIPLLKKGACDRSSLLKCGDKLWSVWLDLYWTIYNRSFPKFILLSNGPSMMLVGGNDFLIFNRWTWFKPHINPYPCFSTLMYHGWN